MKRDLSGTNPSREAENLDALEVIYTARAMRHLKADPVPVETLARIVEAGTMAPTNSNRQNWCFVVVTDRELLARLGEIQAELFERSRAYVERLPERLFRSVEHLALHLGEVPALIVVGGTGSPSDRSWYAGILPAVQNVILAARAHGLGATLTTLLLEGAEDRVRELLDVPSEVTLVAAIPVGYPEGRFARPPRRPVHEVAHLNRFGQPLPKVQA